MFCSFENNLGETVSIFVKNVTDPVSEFWENKALQQSDGVSVIIDIKDAEFIFSYLICRLISRAASALTW